MTRIRTTFPMLLFVMLMLNYRFPVLAMDIGFSTVPLSEDEEKSFLENWSISVSHHEPVTEPIDCFDVNEEGMIALGFSDSEQKMIGIYTSSGEFQYSYEFECYGKFGLEWDENGLIIYLVRSDLAIAVDTEGKIKNIFKIEDTMKNNSYWNHSVFATKRTVGNCKYVIKNDMGIFNISASSYSQLITIDEDGDTNIIYDVNSSQLLKSIVMFVGVIIFAGIVILCLVKEFIKMYRKIS